MAWAQPTAVLAQKGGALIDATDPGRIATAILSLGYRAKLGEDGVGDPMITSSVGGLDFNIYFYGCTDHSACKRLLFKIGYDLADGTTWEVINDWNASKLFGRAYTDDESDPWLEMPVNLDGGVSQFNFEDTFDWWQVIVAEFQEHIDF